jgi:hypothetical protein
VLAFHLLRQIKPNPLGFHSVDEASWENRMDRDMALEHLVQAERIIAEGERHIDHQERAVAELDRDGHDTQEALALLAMFRRTQAEHLAHRNLLLEMMQHHGRQDASRPS